MKIIIHHFNRFSESSRSGLARLSSHKQALFLVCLALSLLVIFAIVLFQGAGMAVSRVQDLHKTASLTLNSASPVDFHNQDALFKNKVRELKVVSSSLSPEGIFLNFFLGDLPSQLWRLAYLTNDSILDKLKELQGVQSELERLQGRLGLPRLFVFGETKKKLEYYTLQVEELSSELKLFLEAFDHLQTGQRRVLLMLQNHNELRPNGGFWGTFGEVAFKDGRITDFKFDSIYDVDGQLEKAGLGRPPRPLLNLSDKWFLRDRNWFYDFTESAENINQTWPISGRENFDLVIAVTPRVIMGLLEITGPIKTLSGQDVNAENFLELAQVRTAITYDKLENEPKAFFGEFAEIFFQNLLSLPMEKKLTAGLLLRESLFSKDIQLYAKDRSLQRILDTSALTKAFLGGTQDELAIVRANLGGTKTDSYIQEKAELDTYVGKDGLVTNTLKITRKNPLPDQKGLENLSFVRILVPFGSKLVTAVGFDQDPTSDLGKNLPVDEKTYEWENKMQALPFGSISILTGVESGRTFFGGWVRLSGGESREVILTYQLPFKFSKRQPWSFAHQVQAGFTQQEFLYRFWALEFEKKLNTNASEVVFVQ